MLSLGLRRHTFPHLSEGRRCRVAPRSSSGGACSGAWPRRAKRLLWWCATTLVPPRQRRLSLVFRGAMSVARRIDRRRSLWLPQWTPARTHVHHAARSPPSLAARTHSLYFPSPNLLVLFVSVLALSLFASLAEFVHSRTGARGFSFNGAQARNSSRVSGPLLLLLRPMDWVN